jgi:hypothetical protein
MSMQCEYSLGEMFGFALRSRESKENSIELPGRRSFWLQTNFQPWSLMLLPI